MKCKLEATAFDDEVSTADVAHSYTFEFQASLHVPHPNDQYVRWRDSLKPAFDDTFLISTDRMHSCQAGVDVLCRPEHGGSVRLGKVL